MKTTVLLCSFMLISVLQCLIPAYSLAQGNTMQFNQIVLVGSSTQTVPVGKVWKVESVLMAGSVAAVATSINSTSAVNSLILVNGLTIHIRNSISRITELGNNIWQQTSQAYSAEATKLPLWLPAGSTLATSTNVALISVVEFNIVP